MEEKLQFEYAGDLSEELEEISRSLICKEQFYGVESKTYGCNQFLTIYCC